MHKKHFYDTNILLDNYEHILDEPFVISSISIKELESIKTSQSKDGEIKYKARKASHILDENEDKFEVVLDVNDIRLLCNKYGLPETNDNIIICSALKYNDTVSPICFVSNDIDCRLIARDIIGLTVEKFKNDEAEQYKGYKEITGDSDFINNYMNSIDYNKWQTNEYLIINNTDENKTTEMRFNGTSFVSLKLPQSNYIKAKNPLQRCALDLLMNKDITAVAILGGYGSGKSFLTTQMALYNVVEKGLQSKVLGIREAKGEGAFVGFLKGTWEDKTGKFFKPFEQQLKGGEFELNSLISRGVLETAIPFYLKGTTFNNTIILVDEAEDLTESQIRLIGTRIGENGKVYFSGDYEQSLHDKTVNNGLVKMCNELKDNPMFGCIYLGEDVRSETSKLFSNLFK